MANLIYSPRTHFLPGKDPAANLLDPPYYALTINEKWAPFFLGALEVLAQPEYWEAGEAMSDQLDAMLAGLSKTASRLSMDTLDGLFRPAGAAAVVSAPSGITFKHRTNAYDGHIHLYEIFAPTAGPFTITTTFVDIDDNVTPAAIQIRQVRSSREPTVQTNTWTVIRYDAGVPTPFTFTNTNPETALTTENVRRFDLVITAGYWMVEYDIRGPMLTP